MCCVSQRWGFQTVDWEGGGHRGAPLPPGWVALRHWLDHRGEKGVRCKMRKLFPPSESQLLLDEMEGPFQGHYENSVTYTHPLPGMARGTQ